MRKDDPPIIVEQTFATTVEHAWRALTEIDQMRHWYFDNIPDFQPEVGFATEFDVESGGRRFRHMWTVTDAVPLQRLQYDWKYADYPGDAFVVFELFPHDEGTKLKLTVRVRESFPDDIPEFNRESCIAGWNYFIQERLQNYLETDV